jgi:hypothetical protein
MAHEKDAALRVQRHRPHAHRERPRKAEPEMGSALKETQKRAWKTCKHE